MVRPAPQARTRATASPAAATGSGTSSIVKGAPGALSTSAFMPGLCAEHEVGGLEEERPVGAVRMEEGGCVPDQLLHARLLHVAVAAVDLQAPGGNLPCRL